MKTKHFHPSFERNRANPCLVHVLQEGFYGEQRAAIMTVHDQVHNLANYANENNIFVLDKMKTKKFHNFILK